MQHHPDTVKEICSRIDQLLLRQPRVVAAVDGRSAAGKSTLARLLANAYHCDVIHMDDFFLPPELRTPARLGEAGGNIHYERFIEEVIAPLRQGDSVFAYRVFDCSTMAYGGIKQSGSAPLLLCEGAYSTHPSFGALYDIRVFATCSPPEQRRRILARNGPGQLARFEREWIPMEEAYFSAYATARQCDFVLDTEQAPLNGILL
jgi:Uridine kinase